MVKVIYFQRIERLNRAGDTDSRPEEFFYIPVAGTLIGRLDAHPMDKHHFLVGDGQKLNEAQAIAEGVNPGFADREREVSFFDITEIRMDENVVYELMDKLKKRDNLERDIRRAFKGLSSSVDEAIYKFKR